ncbi:hypothetical protein MNB_SV-10-1027 [hydrothermal vent metagenome]|uniref:Uncharacterized protein n=1 Tax=hydrothermal vent metagenome TaxID=652676 RepID=A0A1W1CCC5_9ZZZZ
MIKPFFVLVMLLVLSVGLVAVHYLQYDRKTPQEVLQEISAITNFSSPALSVSYYEPRILFYETASNPAYPQMQAMNRMDFIYEK